MHPTLSGRSEETVPDNSQAQRANEQGLRYGLRDGACQAITQGSGEQYLSAFALLLQASPFQLSVLSALPQLIGTGAQLASVKLLQWFPDRKAIIFRHRLASIRLDSHRAPAVVVSAVGALARRQRRRRVFCLCALHLAGLE